ncbi:MAG: DNA-directed RNA polymerase subunit alpha C-terminal domain-containing protein [Planctomycetota bacterium]|nr:DNA-directed RNA polymerase subunit alpha C-terminal domain-containing protein [Planctomycetota bacterium]
MPSSTSAPDASHFLDALSFNADQLRDAKAAVHDAPEFRRAIEDALRAGGENGLRQATMLYLLSRPDAALDALGDDQSQQGVLVRGLAALETGDPSKAAASFIGLVGTDMEGSHFLTNLATAAALSGDTAMAQKAAAKLPDGADALYSEGIALESDGEYEEARRKYEEAIEKDPAHARAMFRLAHRYDTQGDDEKAIELYGRCIQLNPAHANALQNLALLYEDHDRFQEAESCYRRVLDADPTNVRARIGLKDVIASQNMYYDEDHERREDRRAQVLRTPITEFELSVRSRNCLAKMNIATLGDLVRKTEPELLAYKNFGETSLQEIKDILAQKGLRLGMSQQDDAPLYAAPRQQAEAQLDALFGAPPAASGAPMGGAPAAPMGASAPLGGGSGDPLEVAIEQLDLSIRARRCMDNLEIRTVGDLVQHTEAELLASKNFGQTSLNEVRRKLEGLGVALKRK